MQRPGANRPSPVSNLWLRGCRRAWTFGGCRAGRMNHGLNVLRQFATVRYGLVDQISAFAMMRNENAIGAGCHVRVARDLLHHVCDEAWLLARRYVLLDRIRFRNWSADDVQLFFCLIEVIAVWIIARKLLIELGRFIRLFLLLKCPSQSEKHFIH